MRSFRELVLSVTLILPLLATRLQQGRVLFFFFVDSSVENGNNNSLVTLARANYRPYGINFPKGASSGFTNGRTYVDAPGRIIFMICEKHRT